MNRYEQEIVAIIENILRAVAVVVIDIETATRFAPQSIKACDAMAALLRKQ
jgi:hypothetical protein